MVELEGLTEPCHRREVRSFVRREGRMTQGQKSALEKHWARYGVNPPVSPFFKGGENTEPFPPLQKGGEGGFLDLAKLFGRSAPVILEIGFGNGDHLLGRARVEPQHNFFGVEVHRPGAGRLLAHAAEAGLTNLRVACHDAVEVLKDWLPAESLDELLIYFADPWPKKRHHKRRLIQPAFATLATSRLKPGGRLFLATDWANYAEHMLAVLNAEPLLKNLAADDGFLPRPEARALTKFEVRGQKLGHEVFDLGYQRVG